MKKIAQGGNYPSEQDLIDRFLAGGGAVDKVESRDEREELNVLPHEAETIMDMLVTLTAAKLGIEESEASEKVTANKKIMPKSNLSYSPKYEENEWGNVEEKDRVMWQITSPLVRFTYNKTTETWFNTTGGKTRTPKKHRQLVELIQANIDNTESSEWDRSLDKGRWTRGGNRSKYSKDISQRSNFKKIARDRAGRISKRSGRRSPGARWDPTKSHRDFNEGRELHTGEAKVLNLDDPANTEMIRELEMQDMERAARESASGSALLGERVTREQESEEPTWRERGGEFSNRNSGPSLVEKVVNNNPPATPAALSAQWLINAINELPENVREAIVAGINKND